MRKSERSKPPWKSRYIWGHTKVNFQRRFRFVPRIKKSSFWSKRKFCRFYQPLIFQVLIDKFSILHLKGNYPKNYVVTGCPAKKIYPTENKSGMKLYWQLKCYHIDWPNMYWRVTLKQPLSFPQFFRDYSRKKLKQEIIIFSLRAWLLCLCSE